MKRSVLWSGLVLGLLAAGCGGGSGGGGGTTALPATSPFDIGPRAAESPVNDGLATTGEQLFKSKTCSTCHGWGVKITGPDLKATIRASYLSDEVKGKILGGNVVRMLEERGVR